MIRIDGIYDVRKLVANAYKMSIAEGFGVIAFREGDLKPREIDRCIRRDGTIRMDLVNGRKVTFWSYNKQNVPGMEDGIYINTRWNNHTDEQFKKLLRDSKINGNA